MNRTRNRILLMCCGLLAAASAALLGNGARPVLAAGNATTSAIPAVGDLDARFKAQVQPVLRQHCYACHGNGKHKGDLALDAFVSLKDVQAQRRTWRAVGDMMQTGEMPPDNKPRPTPTQIHEVVAFVDAALEHAAASAPRDPGRVVIRRLNRAEYNNTIRDLVGVDFKPAADFPADDTGYGFDNIADVLTLSPLLAERYLAAAETLLDRALTDTRLPAVKTIKWAGVEFKPEVGFAVDGTSWHLATNGQITRRHEFPAEGDYEVRIRAFQEPFGNQPAKMAVRLDGRDLQTFDVPALKEKPGTYTLKLRIPAGSHKLGLAYLNNAVDRNNPDPKRRGDRNLIVQRVEVEGPHKARVPDPTESHRKLLFVTPGPAVPEEQAARQVIERFATRAFRRPVQKDEVERLLALYRRAKAEGDPKFEEAIRVPLSAVLVSPHFLFRIEPDPEGPAGTVRALNDYELASRLSYFLWSSMPDEELFALAAQGKLRDPATLDKQIRRMTADPKAAALVKNFVGQWLELRNLDSHSVDSQRYREFNDRLRQSMKRETELFFEHLIREDRSLVELISADYTYVNEPLARLYGIRNAPTRGDDEFVKVSLAGTRRAGIMTHASILTITAMPTRTSPVKRGVFVLENVLGTPPPPPPNDVPRLPDKPRDEAAAPLRDRLAAHRADPNCSVCHMRMDGIGFTLENFDAIGAWREKDGRFPVDSTGELPGGKKISGPDGLREMVLARKNDVVRCVAEKMFTYALGRGVEEYDRPAIKDICAAVEKDGYRFSALVSGIVKADAFLKKRKG